MKSSKRQRLISFLCVFLVTIISVGSITAMASSKYGIATIKPTVPQQRSVMLRKKIQQTNTAA